MVLGALEIVAAATCCDGSLWAPTIASIKSGDFISREAVFHFNDCSINNLFRPSLTSICHRHGDSKLKARNSLDRLSQNENCQCGHRPSLKIHVGKSCRAFRLINVHEKLGVDRPALKLHFAFAERPLKRYQRIERISHCGQDSILRCRSIGIRASGSQFTHCCIGRFLAASRLWCSARLLLKLQ
jgi:hypothetical protein